MIRDEEAGPASGGGAADVPDAAGSGRGEARGLTAGLAAFLAAAGAAQWGVAACPATPWPYAPPLPRALSVALRLDDAVLDDVCHGPTPAYYAEYRRINAALRTLVAATAEYLRGEGAVAVPVQPTGSPDPEVTDWSDARVFAHKTAATQAGLGWIGKTALFVSCTWGPRVRLATVFTDAALPAGAPVTESRCGACRLCVDACPARAGRDVLWRPGTPRGELLDFAACERENASHIGAVGDICGVCVAVCPRGGRLRSRPVPATGA